MQTFTGKEYLKIDIASSFGLDKESWNDRITWFNQNEHQLHQLVDQADTPALFYAGVLAWEDTKAGKPTGHMISLDATSSGLQILAALTGDRSAARLCNVVPTGRREDAYTRIYREMLKKTGGTSKIDREGTKEAIMTGLYGSTAVPKRVFGEGELLTVFYNTMHEQAPAAWELNEAMVQIWDPNASEYSWVMADNFHVNTKVMADVQDSFVFFDEPFDISYKVNAPTESGRALGANMTHSIDGLIVRELVRRCDYDPDLVAQVRKLAEFAAVGAASNRSVTENDKLVATLWDRYKKSGYLSARIIEHLELENFGHVCPTEILKLLDSLPEHPFKVVCVHDCFRCHPNYGNDLRLQYNIQLAAVAKSSMLEDILSQIIGKPVSIGKLDPNMHLDIIPTDYALS